MAAHLHTMCINPHSAYGFLAREYTGVHYGGGYKNVKVRKCSHIKCERKCENDFCILYTKTLFTRGHAEVGGRGGEAPVSGEVSSVSSSTTTKTMMLSLIHI